MIHLHCGEVIGNVFKLFFKLLMGLILICSYPKSKTPGTLTQVAYDKNSINDIVSLVILVQIEKIVLPGEPCRLLK